MNNSVFYVEVEFIYPIVLEVMKFKIGGFVFLLKHRTRRHRKRKKKERSTECLYFVCHPISKYLISKIW